MNAPADLPMTALKNRSSMTATVVYAHNPFDPADREIKHIHRRRRIDKLAPETTLPFIAILNGQPILRANKGWHKSLNDGDVLVFVLRPQGGGGGGSNPLKTVLMIGISLAAPGIGNALAASMGLGVGATAGTFLGMTASEILGGVVGFAGKMLVNAMMPDGGGGSTHHQVAQQNITQASPTYSLTAQGNAARLLDPIPVQYGRHIAYPDFAAEPYTEYAGNEQYLYQLFCLGQGEYSVEQVRIEDTDISSFPEVTYEVVPPGQQVTLFPTNVVTAPEVNGQEMLTNTALGPFAASAPGATSNFIGIDAVLPNGIFYANDNGGLDGMSTTFKVEARAIDDLGAPIGAGTWSTLGTETISGATNTPQRRSYRYAVAAARYEVKVTRTDAKNTNARAGHTITWAGMRAYLPGTQSYGDVTMIAMRLRATNSLSAQTSRRVNVISTRKLPIWNGTTWSAPTATRNPCWALADVLRSSYGGKLPNNRIALSELLTLAATFDTRGDHFDGRFDQRSTIFDALTAIGRAGRTKPFQQAGAWHFWRDQAQTLPVAMFNMRNIVRGSVKAQYLTPDDDTADAIIAEFFNENTWAWETVTAKLPDSYVANPAKKRYFGITNRAHAWREAMFDVGCNRYRRNLVGLQTEMEGYIPTYGDLTAVQHDRPRWGQSGEIVAWDAGTLTATVSEPLDFSAGGTHYIALRKRNGGMDGPFSVTAGVDTYHVVLASAPSIAPYTGNAEERTSYHFGPADQLHKLCLVRAIRPRSLERVELALVIEDPVVHTLDTGTVPAASSNWNLPARITRPLVSGLNVALGGTAGTPLLLADWQPASGADHYHVEYTYDAGSTWQRAGDTTATNIGFPARRGSVTVRVRGVGLATGDWAVWTGDPFMAPPADVSTFLVAVQPDGTRQFDWTMTAIPPDLAGWKIRYRLGTGWGWGDLYALHDGLLTASPYETNQLAAGTYTFAIKAVDDTGHESTSAVFITADLADPRLAGVIYAVMPNTQGWPGTKTSCIVEPETNTLSAADIVRWMDLTTWDAYTRWVMTPAASMTYQHTDIDLGGVVTFVPLISAIADGTQTIEEQHSNDGISWSAWAATGARLTARYIRIRIAVSGSFPRLYNLDIKLNGGATIEEINDLNTASLTGAYRIGVGDIRLPITHSPSVITQVQAVLQNVGAGWSWELIDKDVAVGPRIKIYNAANALADCTLDAFIREY